MLKGEVGGNQRVLRDIAETLKVSPGLMNTAFRLEERRLGRDMFEELQVEGSAPVHPFIWSEDKAAQARAARYYHWAVKRGIIKTSGGRYARSGKHIKGWKRKFVTTPDGTGYWEVTNQEPGSDYLYGLRQVPSHAKSKWPYAPAIFTKYRRLSTQRLREIHITIIDSRAGVR